MLTVRVRSTGQWTLIVLTTTFGFSTGVSKSSLNAWLARMLSSRAVVGWGRTNWGAVGIGWEESEQQLANGVCPEHFSEALLPLVPERVCMKGTIPSITDWWQSQCIGPKATSTSKSKDCKVNSRRLRRNNTRQDLLTAACGCMPPHFPPAPTHAHK